MALKERFCLMDESWDLCENMALDVAERKRRMVDWRLWEPEERRCLLLVIVLVWRKVSLVEKLRKRETR